MWLALRRTNLELVEPLFRGNAHESFVRTLSPGDYYLQVVTSADQRHRPDGTNIGTLVIRARPLPSFDEPVAEVNLGPLSAGSTLKATGAIGQIFERKLNFDPSATKNECPTTGGTAYNHFSQSYSFTAPNGVIRLGLKLNLRHWRGGQPRLLWLRKGNPASHWV